MKNFSLLFAVIILFTISSVYSTPPIVSNNWFEIRIDENNNVWSSWQTVRPNNLPDLLYDNQSLESEFDFKKLDTYLAKFDETKNNYLLLYVHPKSDYRQFKRIYDYIQKYETVTNLHRAALFNKPIDSLSYKEDEKFNIEYEVIEFSERDLKIITAAANTAGIEIHNAEVTQEDWFQTKYEEGYWDFQLVEAPPPPRIH